jgi:hypothetical protein
MTNPEQRKPESERAAESNESESLSLDKETLKDLDASGEQKGGFGVDWTNVYTTECLSKGCLTTIRA